MRAPPDNATRSLALWLLSCCGLIFVMIVVGAITRLTESGLSIVEWRPVTGTLPPLSQTAWERAFALYKESPEYHKVHFWMELSDFKRIFFWEWLHRLLGRAIGLLYALPLLVFWIRGMIPKGYGARFLAFLVLGGLQGLLGWVMVQSGLVDRPSVSHYRLAAHLSLALAILCLLLWTALDFLPRKQIPCARGLIGHGLAVLSMIAITIIWGAFTAGLDAGLVYNESFPKMGGHWIPPDLWTLSPAWVNIFETPAAVQFAHRWLAITAVLGILSLWAHARLRQTSFPALHALAFMALMQAGLGISTLLSGVALPLAVAHQAGAVILLGLLVAVLKEIQTAKSSCPETTWLSRQDQRNFPPH
ncbi:MAG: COX15/CtaA family protein [Alphaproteobacteria bacterium]|nr:COX15/CtaA family protein [Alphaproteobacteria bacterium]